MGDLRRALRMIGRTPILAAVIVLSLGAGIGVNTVVFSWIQARVFKPIPGVEGASEFHLVESRTDNGMYPGVSWAEYRDLRESLRSFQELLAFRMAPLYVGEPGSVERAYGLLVSDNYFSALGLRPALGRFPRPEEADASGNAVAVISHDYWRTRFDGDPGVTTRMVRVNGQSLPIVGVTPEGFQGTVLGLTFDVWLPAALSPDGWRDLEVRSARGFSVIGKLRPGSSRSLAQSDLDVVMRRLAVEYPQTNATVAGEVLPFWQSPRGPQRFVTSAIATLQAVMLLLLLAVSGNAANLVLARASARQREMGIRMALGATPARVFALMLTENMLLALLGAALGAAIAVWGTDALRAVPMIRGVPIKFHTSIDAAGAAFAAALGVVCGLIVGVAPALQLARIGPHTAFRSGSAAGGRNRLRHALMGIQAALALGVLVAAAVFFRAFMETRDTDPGFRREGVLLAPYDFSGRGATETMTRTFAINVLERLRAQPAVGAAAIGLSVPLDIHGLPSRFFTLEGRGRPDADPDQALVNTVTPGYFRVMDIPIVAGRDFVELTNASTAPEAIVNEEFVRRYVGRAEPLGRRIEVRGRTYAITGVVRNTLYNAFGEPATPAIYFSYRDLPSVRGEIHVRARGGSEVGLAQDVRRAVRDLDPELPVFNVRTMTEHVDSNLIFRRVPARMFAVLGPLLLMLTSIGIYAVVSYTVSLRTTEIGVRLALGATTQGVIAQFVGQSLAVVAAGALIGWAIAFFVAIDLAGSRAIEPSVFLGVPALLLSVAAAASWLPVRRAVAVDPMQALRQE
jgi:putative ABC transport system permease protein